MASRNSNSNQSTHMQIWNIHTNTSQASPKLAILIWFSDRFRCWLGDVHVKHRRRRRQRPRFLKLLPNYSATIINWGLAEGVFLGLGVKTGTWTGGGLGIGELGFWTLLSVFVGLGWLVYLKIIPRLTCPRCTADGGAAFLLSKHEHFAANAFSSKQKQYSSEKKLFSQRERRERVRESESPVGGWAPARKCVTWQKLLYNIFRVAFRGRDMFRTMAHGRHLIIERVAT